MAARTELVLNAQLVDGWMQALLLSNYMAPSVHAKVVLKLLTRDPVLDPYKTLVLMNEGLGQKLLQLNPKLEQSWPTQLSFLLKNALLCKRDRVQGFAKQLAAVVKQVLKVHRESTEVLVLGGTLHHPGLRTPHRLL